MKLIFVNICEADVSQDVLNQFDCGHLDFNDFIRYEAKNFRNRETVLHIYLLMKMNIK